MVAGSFYPGSIQRLEWILKECFLSKLGPGYIPNKPDKLLEKNFAIIVPHAGYIYSGPVAAHAYAEITKFGKPELVILIGPNHTGLGPIASIMSEGEWSIPTGRFRINSELAREIIRRTNLVSPDTKAHLFEHSLEVQLPFIAYRAHQEGREVPEIVPLVLGPLALDECRTLGEVIGMVVSDLKLNSVIVASSDMSHYVSDSTARQKDKKAIQRILSLDPEGLYHIVKEEKISMC
ncbi:MAG: AmmeMemoRadiSam system protein B, partial [Brevinematales bacterium]